MYETYFIKIFVNITFDFLRDLRSGRFKRFPYPNPACISSVSFLSYMTKSLEFIAVVLH